VAFPTRTANDDAVPRHPSSLYAAAL